MRLAIIKDNKVENVVISDLDFANQMGWDFIELDEVMPCEPGWLYDGEKFTSPIIESDAEVI